MSDRFHKVRRLVLVGLLHATFLASIQAEAQERTTDRAAALELLNRVSVGVVRPVMRCRKTCRRANRCEHCREFKADYEGFRKLAELLKAHEDVWSEIGPRISGILAGSEADLDVRHTVC